MSLPLYNTMGRKMEDFVPITPGKAGFYGCGPTVYNYAHIGNLRAYVFLDILDKTLSFLGYDVTHVMNITDIGHLEMPMKVKTKWSKRQKNGDNLFLK